MKRIFFTLTIIAGLLNYTQVKAQSNNKSVVDYHQKAETKFIEADGTKYAYRILGKQEGIPLVFLLHSFSSIDDWDPTITNGLAQSNKVILFDNKGVGSSSGKTPDNIAQTAKDAVTFIKALGYDKVNILGYSMGGMVTQQILLTEPQLVNKVILIGTGPKGAEGLSNLGKTLTDLSNLKPEQQLRKVLFTESDQSQSLGTKAFERIQKRQVNRDPAVTNETIGAQLTAVLGWAQPNAEAFNELKTITQPILIFEGKSDILVPVINSFNLYNNLPNAKLALYPDAAHGSLFQLPEEFLHEAIPFLQAK